MSANILLRRIPHYDLPQITAFVREAMAACAPAAFSSGKKVLLKPNLLRAAAPELCVTTHPALLEAVCIALKDYGVQHISISDSPAVGSLQQAASAAGYTSLITRYGARIAPFTRPAPLRAAEEIPHLKITAGLEDYDAIVNLPKVKAHRQMTLTVAIKNLFGCVIGKRKPVLHCLVQDDKVKFGRLLVDIARRVNPVLTIADGIQAMQGNGPMNGYPHPLGILVAGRDMTAIDRVVTEITGAPLSRMYVLEAARQRNFGEWRLEHIAVQGETDWRRLAVTDFKLADFEMAISFNPLRLLKSVLRHWYEIGIKEKTANHRT